MENTARILTKKQTRAYIISVYLSKQIKEGERR